MKTSFLHAQNEKKKQWNCASYLLRLSSTESESAYVLSKRTANARTRISKRIVLVDSIDILGSLFRFFTLGPYKNRYRQNMLIRLSILPFSQVCAAPCSWQISVPAVCFVCLPLFDLHEAPATQVAVTYILSFMEIHHWSSGVEK